jgi:hypothetical protein
MDCAVAKPILSFVCIAIAVIVFLSLRACFQSVRPDVSAIASGQLDNSVVALGDGSVMIAQPGTLSRDVVDWFNDKNAAPKHFNVGWLRFVPGSAEPTVDTQVRLQRFAFEMKANPAVTAKVQVCTSSSDAADARLAALRANHLKAALVANRVDADRIATQTCQMRGSANAAQHDVQFIGVVLAHGS